MAAALGEDAAQFLAREGAAWLAKHHFPGTVCEPLVFSSLGGHTPATSARGCSR